MQPPSNARRQPRRPIAVAVERLEPRRLRAGLASVCERSTVDVQVDSAIAVTQPGADAASASAATADTAPAGRTDAYVLAAGDGDPEIQIELRWGGGADPTAGATLAVLDAAGALLYNFPLDSVATLDVSIAGFSTPGASTGTTPSLELTLTIQRGDADPSDPGTYQLQAGWGPPAAAPMPPGNAPGNLNPGGVAIPVGSPSPPSLTITNTLPAGNSGSLDPGSMGEGTTTPIPPVVGLDPSGTGTATPAPSTGGSGTGGRSATNQGTGAPSPASPTTGAQGAATIVGPLPLGPSVPDGGIFAVSFRSGTPGAGPGSFSVGMASDSRLASVATAVASGDLVGGAGRLVGPGIGRGFRVAPPIRQGLDLAARTTPAGDDATRAALAAQAAFLPLLEAPTPDQPDSPPSPAPPGRPRHPGRGWINPTVAALAVFTTSAAFALRLNAPRRPRDRHL